MAAKKKPKVFHPPELRDKALKMLSEQNGAHGAIALVAKRLKLPASAVQYWAMAARKAKPAPNGNGTNGHAPAALVSEQTVSPSAQALAEALGTYLDTLIARRVDHLVSERMRRAWEKP